MKISGQRLTPNEALHHYRSNSKCFVTTFGEPFFGHQIEFLGECAKLPSLKNSKIPGTNFINPDVTSKLRAMTELYFEAAGDLTRPNPSRALFVSIYMIKRNHRFDEDNALASVKDWMEPYTARRRWGVGIVDNDTQINGQCITWDRLGLAIDRTVIIVRYFDEAIRAMLLSNAKAIVPEFSFTNSNQQSLSI